jgi:hypothetical protein
MSSLMLGSVGSQAVQAPPSPSISALRDACRRGWPVCISSASRFALPIGPGRPNQYRAQSIDASGSCSPVESFTRPVRAKDSRSCEFRVSALLKPAKSQELLPSPRLGFPGPAIAVSLHRLERLKLNDRANRGKAATSLRRRHDRNLIPKRDFGLWNPSHRGPC